jgi:hypothetical protein
MGKIRATAGAPNVCSLNEKDWIDAANNNNGAPPPSNSGKPL